MLRFIPSQRQPGLLRSAGISRFIATISPSDSCRGPAPFRLSPYGNALHPRQPHDTPQADLASCPHELSRRAAPTTPLPPARHLPVACLTSCGLRPLSKGSAGRKRSRGSYGFTGVAARRFAASAYQRQYPVAQRKRQRLPELSASRLWIGVAGALSESQLHANANQQSDASPSGAHATAGSFDLSVAR